MCREVKRNDNQTNPLYLVIIPLPIRVEPFVLDQSHVKAWIAMLGRLSAQFVRHGIMCSHVVHRSAVHRRFVRSTGSSSISRTDYPTLRELGNHS